MSSVNPGKDHIILNDVYNDETIDWETNSSEA
jgi:hypothetical protein